MKELSEIERVDESVGEKAASLWSQKSVRHFEHTHLQRGYRFHANTEYFLGSIVRMSSASGYVPTEEDIVRSRDPSWLSSSSSSETLSSMFRNREMCFKFLGAYFRLAEPDAVRSAKDLEDYDDIKCLVLCVPLDDFEIPSDQNYTNKLVQSLKLFDKVCNDSSM